MAKPRKDETVYSLKIDGARENYHAPVRFDLTGDILGITQWDEAERTNRVLLSKGQVRELIAFIKLRGEK